MNYDSGTEGDIRPRMAFKDDTKSDGAYGSNQQWVVNLVNHIAPMCQEWGEDGDTENTVVDWEGCS